MDTAVLPPVTTAASPSTLGIALSQSNDAETDSPLGPLYQHDLLSLRRLPLECDEVDREAPASPVASTSTSSRSSIASADHAAEARPSPELMHSPALAAVDPPPELASSNPANVEPGSGTMADNPVPVGPPSPSKPAVQMPHLSRLELDPTRKSKSCPPQSTSSSYPPPLTKRDDAPHQNGRIDFDPQLNYGNHRVSGQPQQHPQPQEQDSWYTRSTSYSGTRLPGDASTTSDYLDLGDPITYENARHFPPRMPTARPFSDAHKRSSATKKIHSWIVRHESPLTTELGTDAHSEHNTHDEDVDYFSEDSYSSDDSFNSEIEDLWRQLKNKRSRVTHIKEQMREKRQELRSIRRKKEDADNAFMRDIRPILVSRGPRDRNLSSEMELRFADMQSLRTEYQYLETSYEDLEDRLDQEEALLHQVEVRFFSLLGSGSDEADLGPPEDEVNDVPIDLKGITADKTEDQHPLFVELTLAVASLKNGREELSHLRQMKTQCDAAVDVKRRFGQHVPRELTDFLSDYSTREASKMDEVSQSEKDVNRLKRLCEEKDVMSKHLSTEMVRFLDPDAVQDDIPLVNEASMLSTHKTLAHPFFSQLLSQPVHLLEEPLPLKPDAALQKAMDLPDNDSHKERCVQMAQKEVEIDSLMDKKCREGGTSHFINDWILYSLRISPLNVALLYSVMTSKLQVHDRVRWQKDVLRYWLEDDTTTMFDLYEADEQGSEYYPRIGTPPRTRAASEGAATRVVSRDHQRLYSSDGASYATR